MSQEYRNEPDWIGIDAKRYREEDAAKFVLQLPKETKAPLGFAPPPAPPPESKIEIARPYRERE